MKNNKQHQRLVELIKECPSNHPEDIADHLIKNNILSLPHALGSEVYCLAQPCGGCKCYNEPMTEEFIEECRKCDKWEIIECDFDYELIPEWGKTVFLTKEEAEGALKGGVQG